jgi:peptidoglycan/LPS O-acetylase OafA/YrhL
MIHPHRIFGLDIIRAAAIAMVLVGHFLAIEGVYTRTEFPISIMVSGYFGVELFFVLSGFLIGSLLLDIVERGASFREWIIFMTRRWMRTIPLYVLWIAVLFVFIPPPNDVIYAVRYLTFTQNLVSPIMPGGWGGWFGHSWSLAVEEWFYLLFSAALLSLAVFWRRRAVFVCCAIFLIVPLVLRFNVVANFQVWDSIDEHIRKVVVLRLDAIAYGVLMATLYRYTSWVPSNAKPLAVGGAVLISLNWWLHSNLIYFYPETPLLLTLPSISFAMFLPFANQIKRMPKFGSIVIWLSTRSYGLYIIHFSALQYFYFWITVGLVQNKTAIFYAAALTVALAELSFRFFESPILRARPRQFSIAKPIAA